MFLAINLHFATSLNTTVGKKDQSAYLHDAKQMARTNYAFTTDRNRMPLYLFLQSLIYREGMTRERYFYNGKMLNSAIAIAAVGSMYLVARAFLPVLASVNFALIVALTALAWKAAFVQAEVTYYLLFFCAFALCARLLVRPTWRGAALAGVVTGLAHLTKASVTPLVVLFVLVAGARALWLTFAQPQAAGAGGAPLGRDRAWKPWATGALVVVVFLATVFPYILTSKRVFGHWFYNVNTRFYFWCDSWAQAEAATKAHGDRVGWPTMPADQIPGPAKYLREHTPRQIAARFAHGFEEVWEALRDEGRVTFLILYLIGLGVFAFLNPAGVRAAFSPGGQGFLILFAVLYLLGYAVLSAFYAKIVEPDRFVIAHFAPLMLSLSVAIQHLSNAPRSDATASRPTAGLFHRVVLAVVAIVVIITAFTYREADL